MAIERYLVVCHPFFKLYYNWRQRVYLIPTAVFAIAYNMPKFFEFQVDSVPSLDGNTTFSLLTPTDLRVDVNYISLYMNWSNLLFNGKRKKYLIIFQTR